MSSHRRRSGLALALLFAPAILGGAVALFHVWESPQDAAGWYKSLAVLFALVAIGLAPAQAALGSRHPSLERSLGLERMLRTHEGLGKFLVGLLVAHGSLMYAAFMAETGRSLLQAFLTFAGLWEMALGMTALTLVILAAAPASLAPILWKQRRQYTLQGRKPPAWLPKPPPFSWWKSLHLVIYAAIPAGMLHGYFRGGDMDDTVAGAYWLLCIALFLTVAAQRGLLAFSGSRRMTMRVADVRPENHDVTTIVLAPLEGAAPPDYLPGQFMLVRIPIEGRLAEPHPFTISCPPAPPSAGELCFSVKREGRFTRSLHNLAVGAEVHCEGPYGIFCRDAARALRRGERNAPPLALIAGGIGITPFLSLLRDMAAHQAGREEQRSRQAHLVWANKTVADAFALAELKELSRVLDLSVTHVFSRETAPEGLGVEVVHGHVTRELLERLFSGREAFHLCGPPPMQQAVLRALSAAFGTPEGAVEREVFVW